MRKAIDDRDIGRVRTLIVKYGLPEGEERVSFYFFFFGINCMYWSKRVVIARMMDGR